MILNKLEMSICLYHFWHVYCYWWEIFNNSGLITHTSAGTGEYTITSQYRFSLLLQSTPADFQQNHICGQNNSNKKSVRFADRKM